MTGYVLIESRPRHESGDVSRCFELAESLAGEGHRVTLFLVQNGVLTARTGASAGALDGAIRAGVTLLADDFSLRERGIGDDEIDEGIASSSIDVVIDRLVAGDKVIWH